MKEEQSHDATTNRAPMPATPSPILDVRTVMIAAIATAAAVACGYDPRLALPVGIGIAVFGLLNNIISR